MTGVETVCLGGGVISTQVGWGWWKMEKSDNIMIFVPKQMPLGRQALGLGCRYVTSLRSSQQR